MRTPVNLPRDEGPPDSLLERALGQLLSFTAAPVLAGGGLGVELLARRGRTGSDVLATPGGTGSAVLATPGGTGFDVLATPGGTGSDVLARRGGTGSDDLAPSALLPTEAMDDAGRAELAGWSEHPLRAALADLGLDEASVALLTSAATTLAAINAGLTLADLPPCGTTRSNRSASGQAVDAETVHVRIGADNGGGETGEGVPDAAALEVAGRRVLDRIEDLHDLGARLEGAVVAAAGQLTARNARLLLAGKGCTDPDDLSPTARQRWAARSRSSTAHELSAATGWGIGETRDLVALATAPAQITTSVTAALAAGTVSWRLVRRYWRAARGAGLDVSSAGDLAHVMFGTDADVVAVERLAPDGRVSALPWAHGQFHHALDRETAKITAADPATARTGRENAKAARDARVEVHDDGTATLTITSTPTQAAAIADRLHAAARAARRHGDTRTLAQLRADTACALLLHATLTLPDLPSDPDLVSVEHTAALAAVLQGLPAGTLNVIVPWTLLHPTSTAQLPLHPHRCSTPTCPASDGTPIPGQSPPRQSLPGQSPPGQSPPGQSPSRQAPPGAANSSRPSRPGEAFAIAQATGTAPTFLTATEVADLVVTPGTTLHRLVVDPLEGRCIERSTTAYQPDAHMRAQAMAADGTCRAPGCTRPAIHTQLDHVHEHGSGGTTTVRNLQCLCTTHHSLKTAGHWTATIDRHRTVTWKTLLGRIYATRVHDHRAYLTLVHAATSAVDHASDAATTDDVDPATARADAIDQAIYTALCHRRHSDPLPTAEDDLTPFDNPDDRTDPRDGGPGLKSRTATDGPDHDRAWTADPATTLTHTDADGHRRWGPRPPAQNENTPAADADDTAWDRRTYGPPPF